MISDLWTWKQPNRIWFQTCAMVSEENENMIEVCVDTWLYFVMQENPSIDIRI